MTVLEDKILEARHEWQQLADHWTPASEIQMYNFLGKYALGIEVYENIKLTSGEDHRWAGHCFNATGQYQRAKECLMTSIALGVKASHADLAFTMIVLGELEQAEKELEQLKGVPLLGGDMALFYRAYCMLWQLRDQNQQALQAIQKAWRAIQGTPEFKFLAPRVLVLMSNILRDLRDREQCDYFLKRAEEICVNQWIWNIRSTRMVNLFEMGQFQDCKKLALLTLKECEITGVILTARLFTAKLHLLENAFDLALKEYQQALDLSSSSHGSFLRPILESDLVAIHTFLGNLLKAQEYLYLCEQHAKNEEAIISHRIRKAYFHFKNNTWTIQEVITEFQTLLELQSANEELLEHIRIHFYMCEVLLERQFPEAERHIQNAINLMLKHNCRYYAIDDLILLPQMHARLAELDLIPELKNKNKRIQLKTIDTEHLRIDGEIIPVPLRRTIEVLAFLAFRKSASMQDIVLHVFGDMPRDSARNYFHQIRHQMGQKAPQITIGFDRNTRQYFIEQLQELEWDLTEHLQGAKKLTGIFLPSSGSDWVVELNQQLGNH